MLNREIKLFLINGLIGVIIAYIIYMILMISSLNINFSSSISYFAAILYGYFANKKLTFKNLDNISLTNISKYIVLHLCTLVIFVYLNSYLVIFLEDYTYNLLIAFILPVNLTMILNFLGLRFWVFKKVST